MTLNVQVDGHPVAIATGGAALAPDGPVMLLLHGAGMDRTAWQLQTRWLAHHGVRPLAVDLPGHGLSGGPPLESIAAMADWTADLIEALEPEIGRAPVHLAGHSMGTFIALETAARSPHLAASLTLIATAESMGVHPALAAAAGDDLAKAAALMASWGHGPEAQTAANPTPGMSMIGGARALVETSPPGALATDFAACAGYTGASAAFAGLSESLPVQMMSGQADKMTPLRSARALADSAPPGRVRFVTVDGGHMLMTEQPAAVRRLLRDAAVG